VSLSPVYHFGLAYLLGGHLNGEESHSTDITLIKRT